MFHGVIYRFPDHRICIILCHGLTINHSIIVDDRARAAYYDMRCRARSIRRSYQPFIKLIGQIHNNGEGKVINGDDKNGFRH